MSGFLLILLACRNNVCNYNALKSHTIGRQGMPFQLNNRLDILDQKNNWLEAFIIEINGPKIKVHFKGYTSKWEEWVDTEKESYRIKEVGSYSKAHGWARYSQQHQ